MNRNTGIRGLFKPFRSPKEIALITDDMECKAIPAKKIAGYTQGIYGMKDFF